MADPKAERLLNLVIALLATQRPLTVGELRRRVQGYDNASGEAFERMFERDKQDLRELGVPLETVTVDSWHEEVGYRIRRERYELPEVRLTRDEAAAVGLAMRFWRSGEVTSVVARAVRKLAAAGIEVQPPVPERLEPVVDASDPALLPLWRAVRDRRPVRFAYRRSGEDSATTRRIEPWGVAARHGRWYVAGYDLDRAAPRVFRVDRVVGRVTQLPRGFAHEVPADVDVAGMAASAFPPTRGTARLRVVPGAADGLRRQAESVEPGEGFDVVVLAYGDTERTAELLAGHGADVTVLEPPELAAAVLDALRATATAVGLPA